MAIDTSANIAVVTSEERTWRVQIEARKGEDYVITAMREQLGLDSDGKVISSNRTFKTALVIRAAHRDLVGKEPDYVCQDGATVSIVHLLEAIPALIDRWAQQDAAKPDNP